MAEQGPRRTGTSPFRGWILVLLFAVGVVVLGVMGFDRLDGFRSRPLWDKLYATLQLFVLESGSLDVVLAREPQPSVPVALQLARFLAPTVTVFTAVAAVSVLAVIFREHLSRIRVRWLVNDHVLICGLGRCGGRLAKAFRKRGVRVVVIEADEMNPSVGELREAGVVVLIGNGTDRALLRRCRLQSATNLIAVCGDDAVNADVVLAAHELTDSQRKRPLGCYAQIVDEYLRDLLREFAITSPKASVFRLDAFDTAERGAPLILAAFPPFDDRGETPLGPAHPLVVGVGQTGSQLVLSCARTWETLVDRTAGRLPITLIDRQAQIQREWLSLRFPRIQEVCDLHAVDMDVNSPDFHRGDFLDPAGGRPVTGVYISLGDDAQALIAANALSGRLPRGTVPIVVRTTQRSELNALPAGLVSRVEENIREFRLLDQVCTPGVLLNGMNEILAQAIHEDYVRVHRQRGETPDTNPSVVPWANLPEPLKESSRQLADSLGEKLAMVGCEIRPSFVRDEGLTTFSPEEIELLARREHERWCGERQAAGWKLGPTKDWRTKRTPYLISWDQLPEEIRDNDRSMIRGMPSFLARAGFVILRKGEANLA